jgi:ornithine cyclodeaminase/alanine dehydrogenase-like protein (mu-crystallin family)
MVLLIKEEDIEKANISPEEVIDAVEDAYLQDGNNLAHDTPRREIKISGKDLPHVAPGTQSIGQGLSYLEGSRVLAIIHSFHFSWHKYLTHILDPSDGKLLAIITYGRGIWYNKGYRTGAAAAIGAKYLAKENVDTIGIIGTGRIGRASLLCLSKVKKFDKVVSNSGKRKDEKFVKEMGKKIGIDINAYDRVKDVVKKSEMLITATRATQPIVKGEWLNKGTHISAMGADCPLKSELDINTIKKANKIVIDGEKCLSIGEIANAINAGIIKSENIYARIGEIIASKKPGRIDDSEITIFESDGTNIQSAGVA